MRRALFPLPFSLAMCMQVAAVTSLLCATPGCSDDDEVLADTQDGGPGGTQDGATSEGDRCQPTCADGQCGNDDGCGGTCRCEGNVACESGVCQASECGVCADNEVCVGGQCICEPSCTDGRADDGCGGTCPCPADQVRGANGLCTEPLSCQDTCETAGAACGEVCGEECGTCGEGSACRHGACVCQPQCDGTSCDDGCGGLCECASGTVCNAASECVAPEECHDTCDSTERVCGEMCGNACGGCDAEDSCVAGACVLARNCTDCSLTVYKLTTQVSGGRIQEVELAVDYQPAEGEPRPRLADLRIWADHDVEMMEVRPGVGLTRAKKRLYVDGVSGQAFRKRPDDSFQVLAYGAAGVEPFESGRLLTLRFKADTLGPIRFYLQRRLQVFAPASADATLQSSDYDEMVVVSR